jgi:RoxA-like, cytochrome c-like
MRTSFKLLLFSLAAAAVCGPATAQTVQYLDQGWNDVARQAFYTTTQGSRMIRYDFFKALRRLDVDEPFGGDALRRYGYIVNEKATNGLPIGFVIDGDSGYLGMTCAACHTAQIEYQKDNAAQVLRIDGAPATANFQLFLTELTDTARKTLSDAGRFDAFAHAVLGTQYSQAGADTVKSEFKKWVDEFGGFMDTSLPKASPWGPGRLDAFGMIFNRVAGLDLGVPGNIKLADAPVSYPFLWNASKQDKTQWNGGVPNGLFIQALGRNTGEVFGVFAHFKPVNASILPPLPGLPPVIDYSENSANFRKLQSLEEMIAGLQAPKWPFALDNTLVAKGRTLFDSNCRNCHDQTDSKEVPDGWVTPVVAVGTDSRMFDNAQRTSQPGLLKGALVPDLPIQVLGDPAKTHDILATTVVGALANDAKSLDPTSGFWRAVQKDLPKLFPPLKDASVPLLLVNPAALAALKTQIDNRLTNMFKPPNPDAPAAYESRVLYGIWATAPYLHNGSVPNLAQLLRWPENRAPSFMVGSRKYDADNVGYVTTETPFKDGTLTVGAGAQPGNSNAGHKYPKDKELDENERKALLEYLKTL